MKARLPAPAVLSKSKQARLREYIQETVEQNLDENRTEYARHYMMLMMQLSWLVELGHFTRYFGHYLKQVTGLFIQM